jgi:hypothetical protein
MSRKAGFFPCLNFFNFKCTSDNEEVIFKLILKAQMLRTRRQLTLSKVSLLVSLYLLLRMAPYQTKLKIEVMTAKSAQV